MSKPATICFVLCLLQSSLATAINDGPHPIWWSDRLNVTSLDDIDAELDKRFIVELQFRVLDRDYAGINNLSWEERADRYHNRTTQLEAGQSLIDNCYSLMNLVSSIDDPDHPLDVVRYYKSASRCYTLSVLKDAKPAQRSFVENFALGEDAPDRLPYLASPHWTCTDFEQALEANAKGEVWRNFDASFSADSVPSYDYVVPQGNGSIIAIFRIGERDKLTRDRLLRYRMSIQARGDFNEDGFEDVLLLVESSYYLDYRFLDDERFDEDERYAEPGNLIVVTRRSANENLRVTKIVDTTGAECQEEGLVSRVIVLPKK